MSDSEDVALAADAIIIAVAASQQNRCRRRRTRRFWIRPSLVQGRKKYSTEENMKNLLLYDDDLNLEYRCDVGSQNFFRMNNYDFENTLSIIATASLV